jgi:hypothetical protein
MAKKTPQPGGRIDPRDPGVRWAEDQLKPIAKLFTTRQHREIVDSLAGPRIDRFGSVGSRHINHAGESVFGRSDG